MGPLSLSGAQLERLRIVTCAVRSFGRNMGKNVGMNLKKVFKPRRKSITDEQEIPTKDASEPAAEGQGGTESSSRAPEAAAQQPQQQSLDQQASEPQGVRRLAAQPLLSSPLLRAC